MEIKEKVIALYKSTDNIYCSLQIIDKKTKTQLLLILSSFNINIKLSTLL